MFHLSAGRATINSILGQAQDRLRIRFSNPVACWVREKARFVTESGPAPVTVQCQFSQFNPQSIVSLPRADKARATLQVASHE